MSNLKMIWTLKSRAGLSEDNFRAIVIGVSGQDSTKSLSELELKKITEVIFKLHPELKKKNWKSRTPEKYPAVSYKERNLATLRTPDQLKYCQDIISAVNFSTKYKELSLDSLSKKTFGKGFERLTRHQEQSLIEALKGILIRSHKEEFESYLRKDLTRNEALNRLLRVILIRKLAV
ncbi:phage protein GemA/Gp16 family protein [Leptospira weilii]|uniref:PF06252 family protein n=1 Tax=Leptospira weilii str. UI 13098 TaxID=1088542 RepID=M6Q704_9LEPT|nr:phage protein GemA/Gp16 family protein [Leptospira weilii]EMN91401.1 PF06252 family protein [Leptospira weilii str. UI 13098]